jgi:hypothetical protein
VQHARMCDAPGRPRSVFACAGLTDLYIMQLSADEAIDATKKGSLARLINHSCEPNCVTQKWLVNGDIRVGIFTQTTVEAGSELTYNYAMDMMSSQVQTLTCISPRSILTLACALCAPLLRSPFASPLATCIVSFASARTQHNAL